MVDGAARDRRLRQLAAGPSAALAQPVSIKKPPDDRYPAERLVGNAAIIALTVIGRQRNKDSKPGPRTTRYCCDLQGFALPNFPQSTYIVESTSSQGGWNASKT